MKSKGISDQIALSAVGLPKYLNILRSIMKSKGIPKKDASVATHSIPEVPSPEIPGYVCMCVHKPHSSNHRGLTAQTTGASTCVTTGGGYRMCVGVMPPCTSTGSHSTLRTSTVPSARTSQATALRHSARRTTTSPTNAASARKNTPYASRPAPRVGKNKNKKMREIFFIGRREYLETKTKKHV